jgi:hypothetical protein
MGVHEIDGTLQRLLRERDGIHANLLELELDPNRELLQASKLEGESARRWAEASAALAQLWRWDALFQEALDRAVHLRGTRARLPATRCAQLEELLFNPSLQLSSDQVPLEQRQLLDGSKSSPRCTPDELAEQMSTAFDEAKAVLAAVGDAWDTLGLRLQDARASLESSAGLASALGEGEPPQLDGGRRRLAELTERLSKDPLSVRSEEVQDLECSLEGVREDLGGLDEVRRELGGRLKEAHELREKVHAIAVEGRGAYEETLTKIAAPKVSEPLTLDQAFDSELEDVAKIAQHGAWREAGGVLEQWTARARSLLEQGQLIVRDNRGPIKKRNELRGLLDACEAKARRLGLVEELELLTISEEARDRLYSAPTDLVGAGELVDRYRRALAERVPPREPLR